MTPINLRALSDTDLLDTTSRLAAAERTATAALIRALHEVDVRRLYLAQGYSGMFTYCTDALRLSEQAAYSRIEVARVSRVFPEVLEAVEEGALTLTTAVLLSPHLTPENAASLLASARFKSKRDVERLLASRNQDPDRAHIVMHFMVDEATYDEFVRARSLARHRVPDGDTATVFKLAMTALIADIERKKAGVVARPRTGRRTAEGSRHIPARIRRAVWARDGARCAFRGAMGRCTERDFLEFHHVKAFAEGGPSTIGNLELRCRAHNAYEAEQMFGCSAAPVPNTGTG